jgi:hypothetical protein
MALTQLSTAYSYSALGGAPVMTGQPLSTGHAAVTRPALTGQGWILAPSPESLGVPAAFWSQDDSSLDTRQIPRPLKRVVTAAALAEKRTDVVVDSTVLQIWEGTVTDVDPKKQVLDAVLTAKAVNETPHSVQIGLEWIADQDLDLVRPGAVFYLTLYRRTQKGSIQNSQELRFRRRPSWNRQQIIAIKKEAELLGRKLVERPRAE